MFKNEVWGRPMSLIFCEGYTDDKATTQKTGKEIRADKGTMSNWHSGYPQSIGLLMINTCGLAWHSGYPQRSS